MNKKIIWINKERWNYNWLMNKYIHYKINKKLVNKKMMNYNNNYTIW